MMRHRIVYGLMCATIALVVVGCSTAPESTKSLCYTGIGEHVNSLFTDRAHKVAECAKSPEAYRGSCESGARLADRS